MISALKKLARSIKYQNLYARAKELNHIRIFENESDFSYLQTMMLYYLELYNSLYTALASGEENLSEEIINDEIRLDAYLLWQEKNKKLGDKKKTKPISEGGVIFRR